MDTSTETASFLRRETQLQVVEGRFRGSSLRLESLVPVESKFQEMFDLDGDPISTKRNSLLFRLQFNGQRRDESAVVENLDGNGSGNINSAQEPSRKPRPQLLNWTSSLKASGHKHLKVPVANHNSRAKTGSTSLQSSRKSSESKMSHGFSSSKEGDDTAQMWMRALHAETNSRSPGASVSSNVLGAPALSRSISNINEVPKTPQPSCNKSPRFSPPGEHSPTCKKRPSQDNDATFWETLTKSNTILQVWAHQLEKQEDEAKERSRGHVPAFDPALQVTKMPPVSWARFPSYNREERNAGAGETDNVKPKDFAVKEVSASGEVNWTTDKLHDDSPPPKGPARAFSGKLAQTFSTRWSKLIPGRSGTLPRRSKQGGRNSSIQAGGDLEYPELELLPTADRYKELRALERGIDELKGTKSQRRSSSDMLPVPHNRPSLTDKMTSALQQHDGGSDAELSETSDMASFFEKPSMVQIRTINTPATQIQYPNAVHANEISGSTVEEYSTPFSHLTASEHRPSREATPDLETGFRLQPVTHSPSSVKSVASVIRRESLHSAPDFVLAIGQLGNWPGRGKPMRRSAPMPVAPSLV